jgi:transposase InsO family protein
MVIVDRLSKRIHLVPAHMTATAEETADLFMQHIFRLHGIPKSILSDRDTKFTSSFWQHMWSRLGVSLTMSTVDHPQTDGGTEVVNRSINSFIRIFANYYHNNWYDLLPIIELTTPHIIPPSTCHPLKLTLDTSHAPSTIC